jgi:hypothetical protein
MAISHPLDHGKINIEAYPQFYTIRIWEHISYDWHGWASHSINPVILVRQDWTSEIQYDGLESQTLQSSVISVIIEVWTLWFKAAFLDFRQNISSKERTSGWAERQVPWRRSLKTSLLRCVELCWVLGRVKMHFCVSPGRSGRAKSVLLRVPGSHTRCSHVSRMHTPRHSTG